MSGPPTSAREALLAEALGDIAKLLDRVDALAPELDRTLHALLQAQSKLGQQAGAFERQTALLTETAKVKAAEYIARRAVDAGNLAVERQTKAMAEAARLAFQAEAGPLLQRLAAALQQAAQSQRHACWKCWAMCTLTAAVSSATTLATAAFIFRFFPA